MRHRADVETQLKARLEAFDFRINASQATRDAAFVAQAFALQEQIAEGQVQLGPPPAEGTTPSSLSAVSSLTSSVNPPAPELVQYLVVGFRVEQGAFRGLLMRATPSAWGLSPLLSSTS